MLIFARSAYMPNAVAEGRNNTKAFGFNAHAEGMNCSVVFTTIKTTIEYKKKIKEDASKQEK